LWNSGSLYSISGTSPVNVNFDSFLFSISPNATSNYTKDTLRTPDEFLHTYHQAQILLVDYNSITQAFFQVFINDVVLISSVLCNFVLIRFHHHLTPMSSLVLLTAAAAGVTFLLLSHLKFGEINEFSSQALGSWQRNLGLGCQQLLRRRFTACRDLRVQMGIFGYYTKPASIKILGKLVYYTTKFLILTKAMV